MGVVKGDARSLVYGSHKQVWKGQLSTKGPFSGSMIFWGV